MIFTLVCLSLGVENCDVLKRDHGLVTRIQFKRLAPKLWTYMDSLSG